MASIPALDKSKRLSYVLVYVPGPNRREHGRQWGALASIMAMVAVSLVACGTPEGSTVQRLRTAVAVYAQGTVEPTEQQIEALFARLDADIAALRADAASDPGGDAEARAKALQDERLALWRAYVEAKVERLRGMAERALRDSGKQIGQGIEEAGRRVQESTQKP